jgi:predicted metal-dependent phosphoesterase TrpH
MLLDCHIHSKYSLLDSVSELDDIIEVAKRLGLGAIAISDHNTLEGSLKAAKKSSKELMILPSIEISSADGHIIGLGAKKPVKRDLSAQETVERVHEVGGIAIAAHPYDSFRSGVKDLCFKVDFDAIEINGHCLYGNKKASIVAKRYNKPLVGGSDAHSIGGIGAICTEVPDSDSSKMISNIKAGLCRPVYKKDRLSLKTGILADKIARRYRLRGGCDLRS